MRIYQGELPFNGKGDHAERTAKISWSGSVGDWWYIEKMYNKHECLYADEGGNYYFGQKEFSHVVPVVWNMREGAERVAKKHHGRVKKFPYKLKA